ncbi:hypothetical protein BD770DRAFT_400464 [Pilaira anomala]|nr:hypothetical protein BD770DRAFT_400464 [Pilaira anomala]
MKWVYFYQYFLKMRPALLKYFKDCNKKRQNHAALTNGFSSIRINCSLTSMFRVVSCLSGKMSFSGFAEIRWGMIALLNGAAYATVIINNSNSKNCILKKKMIGKKR